MKRTSPVSAPPSRSFKQRADMDVGRGRQAAILPKMKGGGIMVAYFSNEHEGNPIPELHAITQRFHPETTKTA